MLRTPLSILVSVILLMLSGCDSSPLAVRIGTNVWPGYELLYVAREQGYFDESEAKLVELPSASDVMDAIRLGQLEAGALTLDETLTLIAEGEDLVVVLVFDISIGADVIMARSNIHSLADLKGKTIALETTAVGALMLQTALDTEGLNSSQVNIEHLSLASHLSAFRAHSIDAAVTFEPYASALEKAGAHRLFDSSAVHGQIVDVLAVQRQALNAHYDQLTVLIDGYFRARRDLYNTPGITLKLLNQRLKAAESELPHMLDGLQLPDIDTNYTLLTGTPSPLEHTAQQLIQIMNQYQLLKRPLFISGISQPGILESLR